MQRARVSNHPCHRLSVPSAKRFWCRHCMMVFEDAITRWRHSRTCRSGGFDNFVRRREIETQALQKMAETLDPEMVTPVAVPRTDGGPGGSKELCCFICRQRFVSLDEMREHVKYPCNKPATVQRPSMPLVFPEPTFGTGIQQHYTDGPVFQSYRHPQQGSSTGATISASSSDPGAVTVYMNESEQEQQDSEAKPTNIYVNEKGETVIEVENLDLNTKSGELSLAHLLTQLSQQGIVFDQHPQGETEIVASQQEPQVVQETAQEVDYSQPTAVDAANTLTQLAGSAFRAVSNTQETYVPAVKRIKTENTELQYHLEQPGQTQIHTYLPKEEPFMDNQQEKYIICTNESEVIRVMRANDVSPEESSSEIVYQNGQRAAGDIQSIIAASGEEGTVQTVLYQSQPDQGSQTVAVQEADSAPAEEAVPSSSMIVLQHDQPQVLSTGHLIKTEDTSDQLVIAAGSAPIVEQSGEIQAVPHYPSEGTAVAVIEGMDASQVPEEAKHCLVVSANSQDIAASLTTESAVTGLLEIGGEAVPAKTSEAAVVEGDAEPTILLPQIVSVTSSATDVHQVLLQQHQNTE